LRAVLGGVWQPRQLRGGIGSHGNHSVTSQISAGILSTTALKKRTGTQWGDTYITGDVGLQHQAGDGRPPAALHGHAAELLGGQRLRARYVRLVAQR
jgi:hypothetical protein